MPFAAKISEGFVIIAKNSLDNEIWRNDSKTIVDKFALLHINFWL